MKGVTTIAILLFASIGLNAFLAVEREHNRETLDEARRHGFVAVEDRPGCGWVRVPRCGNCGRFHAPRPMPSMILPGPAPTLAPPLEDFERAYDVDDFETHPTPVLDDVLVDPHELYRRPIEVPEQLYAGP